jgi:hypothetical protein
VDDDDDDDRNSTFLPLLAAVVTLAMQNVFMSQRNEKYQASSVNHRHHSKMCSAGSGRILASPRPRRTAEERKRKEMKHRARWRRFEVNHKGGGRGTEGGRREAGGKRGGGSDAWRVCVRERCVCEGDREREGERERKGERGRRGRGGTEERRHASLTHDTHTHGTHTAHTRHTHKIPQ